MNCPQCGQLTDQGAVFCGNCGQQLQAIAAPVPTPQSAAVAAASSIVPGAPFAQALSSQQPTGYAQALAPMAIAGAQGLPAYAIATPAMHVGETKAVLSIAIGIIGIIGAIVPIIGMLLGITGIILGTMSRAGHKKVSTAGILLSIIALLASLGVWTFMLVNDTKDTQAAATNHGKVSPAVAANSVTTACYTAGFSTELNIATTENSCDMQAYDGTTLNTSTNAYKVYGYKQPTLTNANFMGFAKTALEKDVHDNLPGFKLESESVGQFAGSPAYMVKAVNESEGVAYIEAAVFKSTGVQDNVFVFVHANAGRTTNLDAIEKQWTWK